MSYKTLTPLLLCGLLTGMAYAAPDSRNTEAQLAKSLQAIKNNRLDIALNREPKILQLHRLRPAHGSTDKD